MDNVQQLKLDANEQGLVNEVVENLGINGRGGIEVIGYINGQEFDYERIERQFYDPNEPAEVYTNSFDDTQSLLDVVSGGIFGGQFPGFSSASLNSDHPYPEQTEMVGLIKTPISITSEEAKLTYRDVAIIEPGEEDTEFGDFEFWDFVVVEGSKDGRDWIPLAPGYDARFDSTWLNAYENELSGDESMYVNHTINLTETFEVGDIILVRFRLSSDPNAVGWGWSVDNVQFQDVVLGLPKQLSNFQLEVFPNPIQGTSTIMTNLKNPTRMSVIGINGSIIRRETINSRQDLRFEKGNLKPGIYILRLESDQGMVSKRIIIQ